MFPLLKFQAEAHEMLVLPTLIEDEYQLSKIVPGINLEDKPPPTAALIIPEQ